MNSNKLFIAGLALAALVSCNKETVNETPAPASKDEAYLAVSVVCADSETPSTKAVSGDHFYYGTADENAVKSADFFFYKEDGVFFSHVSQSIEGTGKEHGTADVNVEWVGKGVVILKGLTAKSSPTYMSVILNGNSFASSLDGLTLAQAQAKVVTDLATPGNGLDWTNFVMTSSTYSNGDKLSGYFCTKLNDSMFMDTEAEAQAATGSSCAVAYVERLAAKVKLGLASTLDADKIKIGEFKVNGEDKTLYTKISAWGLNATQKESYIYKNINPSWTLGSFTWNDVANHRSYWAASPNYGGGVYPDSFLNSEDDKNYDPSKATLDYIKYDDCKVALDKNAYCRENTNTEGILSGNVSSIVTSILVKATVIDEDANPVQLVNYENNLWTLDGYKTRVLAKYELLDAAKYIPWLSNNAGETTVEYAKATTDNIVVKNAGDGIVYVQFSEAPEGYKYYLKSASGEYTEVSLDALNAAWERSLTECSYYKDGMMYYNIPVEHLRNEGNLADRSFKEADYGVVRNHWYNVTINSIKNLGVAVFDPAEEIVPNDNTTKKFYVGAQVNILSWKVVNQNVDL